MQPRHLLPSCATSLVLTLFMSATVAAGEIRIRIVERTFSTDLRYECIVSTPDGYEGDNNRRWPMVLFLHGGGTPEIDRLQRMIAPLTKLPAVIVAPRCPLGPDGPLYTNWNWKLLAKIVREISDAYRIDGGRRSVIGFSMGGSGAWELPFHAPDLFAKSVVIAGVCHPWSLRHYPKTKVWAFVGAEDYMRKEQQETVTSGQRFGVDVVETVWVEADHGGIFRQAMAHQPMLDWLVNDEDVRRSRID